MLFHFGLFYFGDPEPPHYVDESRIIWVVIWLLRVGAQSGFIIAFLSTLLLSLNKKAGSGRWKLFGVLALGWLVLSLQMHSPWGISWDVFGLIFAGISTVMAAEAALGTGAVRILGVLGYLMLWLPFWQLAPYLHADYASPVQEALKNIVGVASCDMREVSEWPLLPWTGLVWFGYWMGAEIRRLRDAGQMASLCVNRQEAVAWTVILVATVPQLGAYFHIRGGPYFSCDAYRQAPVIFWSHFVWPLFLIRCSFDPRVQARLSLQGWVRRVSDLAISRKFWLAYLLQYVSGTAIAYALNYWEMVDPGSLAVWELPLLEFLCLTILFQTELMTARADKLIRAVSKWRVQRHRGASAVPIVLPVEGGTL